MPKSVAGQPIHVDEGGRQYNGEGDQQNIEGRDSEINDYKLGDVIRGKIDNTDDVEDEGVSRTRSCSGAPISSDQSSPVHTFHSVTGSPSTINNSPFHQYHSVQGTPSTLPNSPVHQYHSVVGTPSTLPNSPVTRVYQSMDVSDSDNISNQAQRKAIERLNKTKEKLLRDDFNEISQAPEGAQPVTGAHKRRNSKASASNSRSHSRSHSRRISDISDIDLPPLEPLFGPHLYLHPEEETTPDENDLFPSTPLDEEQLAHADSKLQEELGNLVINTIQEEELPEEIGWLDPRWLDPRPLMYNAAEQAEEFAMTVWHKFQSWKVVQFTTLPQWLQDNDFLRKGHRPPLPSFRECYKSIFRIHTETGNIWTHLLGVVAFLGLAVYFVTRPVTEIETQEKMVFLSFFAGAIVCLGLSFTFHTVCCHQNKFIGKLFAKLDYCGIAFLTVGSFVPWLYYSFYCHYTPKVVYLCICIVLGILAVIVSLWDKFGTPRYRPFRAGVFVVFGLSGIAPATHYGIVNGWEKSMNEAAMGWLILMGLLYITGAMLYAFRIPERIFPGKVDILFHSHQLFHCFVIAGAFVHYHGISNMALYRLQIGECRNEDLDLHKYTSFITMNEL